MEIEGRTGSQGYWILGIFRILATGHPKFPPPPNNPAFPVNKQTTKTTKSGIVIVFIVAKEKIRRSK